MNCKRCNSLTDSLIDKEEAIISDGLSCVGHIYDASCGYYTMINFMIIVSSGVFKMM